MRLRCLLEECDPDSHDSCLQILSGSSSQKLQSLSTTPINFNGEGRFPKAFFFYIYFYICKIYCFHYITDIFVTVCSLEGLMRTAVMIECCIIP